MSEQTLNELAKSILEDGVIDEEEVQAIKDRIYADGIIDREEADFLFDLNDGTSGRPNDPSWKDLFVEAISEHILADETSPNEIDSDEGEWLIRRLEGDGQYDDNEKALLRRIKATATKVDDKLKKKMDEIGI